MNRKRPLPAEALTARGFTLQGVLPTRENRQLLPPEAADFDQVLVLGHAGRRLWESLPSLAGDDPIDNWSRQWALEYLDALNVTERLVLFPFTDLAIDLRGLGRALGWHHDSPLGTGTHPVFGSWFAYRAVIALPAVFETSSPEVRPSPCLSCTDKPCLSACPVGATGDVFNLQACASHRLSAPDCEATCLARVACPAGDAFRYGEEQLRYHYRHSLESLRLLHSTPAK